MGWLSGWGNAKRIPITIDSSKVDSNLENFPVLITLSSATGMSNQDTTCVFDELASDANRKKIAVTKSDGTSQCYVEIERWDDSNEEAWLWTKVPTLVSGTDTALYLYYGSTVVDNTTYVGDTGSSPGQNVWSNGFLGVWHMSQDPTGGGACILDSTSYVGHGTPQGTMLAGDLVDGKIGKALDFDGGDDYILGPKAARFENVDAVSVSVILYVRTSGIPVSYDGNSFGAWGLYVEGSNFYISDGGSWDSSGAVSVSASTWTMMCGTWSADSDVVTIYKNDGSTTNSDATTYNTLQGTDGEDQIRIGRRGWDVTPDWFDGIIEEVRISDTERPAAWIKTSYYSSWDDLLTFGSEQIRVQSPDTNQLCYVDPYLYNASDVGLEIYNKDIDTNYAIGYIEYSNGFTCVAEKDDNILLGTFNSGILQLSKTVVSGTDVLSPINFGSYLSTFKQYPDITANYVRWMHVNDDYMCVITASGVDHFNFGNQEAYDRSYATISGSQKCWQTSTGKFYYSSSDPTDALLYERLISLDLPTPMDNFQVKVELTTLNFDYSKVGASGDDLRFYELDGSSIPYWIESWDTEGTSVIWVKVAVAETSSIKMRYGNSIISAGGSAHDTFVFFDDFNDNDYSGIWESHNVSYEIGANNLVVAETGGQHKISGSPGVEYSYGKGLRTTTSYPTPLVYEIDRVSWGGWGNNSFGMAFLYNDNNNYVGYGGGTALNMFNPWRRCRLTRISGAKTWNSGLDTGDDYLHHVIKLVHDGTNVSFYWDDVLVNSVAAATLTNVKVGTTSLCGLVATSIDVRFDIPRVREYAATEPTASVGAEIESPFYLNTSYLNAIYTHQCDWDESSVGYLYDTTTSGGLFPYGASINDFTATEGTSIYRYGHSGFANLLFIATSSGVALIEEKPGDEENSRYKQYFVEGT